MFTCRFFFILVYFACFYFGAVGSLAKIPNILSLWTYKLRFFCLIYDLSLRMSKPTVRLVQPAKTQISLCTHAVWSVFAVRKCSLQPPGYPRRINKNLCHTRWMYRLIWVFVFTQVLVQVLLITGLFIRRKMPWNACYMPTQIIAPDKRGYPPTIFLFLHKNICGFLKCLFEVLLMSTHNIYFHGEIRTMSVLSGWKKAPLELWQILHRTVGVLMLKRHEGSQLLPKQTKKKKKKIDASESKYWQHWCVSYLWVQAEKMVLNGDLTLFHLTVNII